MKKLSLFYSLLFIASLGFLASCGGDDDEPVTPDACATSTYPASTGTATVSILNFQKSEINVSAGDLLSFAVSVTKGTNRPQKLRIYQSDCENTLGTVVEFKGQPKFSGDAFDLRNTDETQIRNVNYTVPTGITPIYISIVIDESGDKFTYKKVKLNVSGSGLINDWSGVELGAQGNAAASRLSSGTGTTYLACNAAENIEYIDITYAVSKTDGKSYLSSNPARFLSPIDLSVATVDCGEDGKLPTDGGKATYFKVSSANFDTADDASLAALTVSSADDEYVKINAQGDVFEFLNSDGKKGLIKISGGTLNNASASIDVDVKVQR